MLSDFPSPFTLHWFAFPHAVVECVSRFMLSFHTPCTVLHRGNHSFWLKKVYSRKHWMKLSPKPAYSGPDSGPDQDNSGPGLDWAANWKEQVSTVVPSDLSPKTAGINSRPFSKPFCWRGLQTVSCEIQKIKTLPLHLFTNRCELQMLFFYMAEKNKQTEKKKLRLGEEWTWAI